MNNRIVAFKVFDQVLFTSMQSHCKEVSIGKCVLCAWETDSIKTNSEYVDLLFLAILKLFQNIFRVQICKNKLSSFEYSAAMFHFARLI